MLAFLPPDDVASTLKELKKIDYNDDRVIEFYDYFEKYYVGELKTKRGRYNKLATYLTEPMFPIKLWNVFKKVGVAQQNISSSDEDENVSEDSSNQETDDLSDSDNGNEKL
ncbi:unnamed protein product [Brachionus calyciflorus]|uniref:Uncharacterized protein n=1 Tax=Brachionus calyciflorus TaxID=104777 RepID=A0A814FID4_9BILA|nr:unnamed protein product [Brachionus calyciflorus]